MLGNRIGKSLTVSNESACVVSASATPFTCSGQISRSLWTDATGQPQGVRSAEQTLSVTGSADPQPAACSSM